MESNGQKYYGKYKGTVINSIDPLQLGRIQVQVAEVSGLAPTTWAVPCVPIAGKQQGIFCVPQMGSGVWVEFEHGEANRPIWVGGFWGLTAEVPLMAFAPPAIPPGQNIVVQTTGQNMVLLSDSAPTPLTGGIVLRSGTSMIVVNALGITITNGLATIMLKGPAVTINQGALVIT